MNTQTVQKSVILLRKVFSIAMTPVRENGESPEQSHSQHPPGDRSVPVGRRWQWHLGHQPVPRGTAALLGTPWPAASPPGWCSHWHRSAQPCRASRRLSRAPGTGKDRVSLLDNALQPWGAPNQGWECKCATKTGAFHPADTGEVNWGGLWGGNSSRSRIAPLGDVFHVWSSPSPAVGTFPISGIAL